MYECPLLAKHAINVAIAGKADMEIALRNVCFWPKADMR